MVEIQWKDRLALEQEWMELYVDMPQEIEILWMNQAEGIKQTVYSFKVQLIRL